MITAEEFHKIVSDLEAGVFITQEQVTRLVATIAELDAQNAIAEGAVHYALAAADQVLMSFGSEIANIIGIRDMGKRRRIAAAAGGAAGQLRASVQLFVQGMVDEANAVAAQSVTIDDADEVGGDESTASPVVGGDE